MSTIDDFWKNKYKQFNALEPKEVKGIVELKREAEKKAALLRDSRGRFTSIKVEPNVLSGKSTVTGSTIPSSSTKAHDAPGISATSGGANTAIRGVLGNKAPYENYSRIRPDLLETKPRTHELTAHGVDIWTCYEFSTLFPNGFPQNGIVKISFPYKEYGKIVESKSLKLYLNSYNNVVFLPLSAWGDRRQIKMAIQSKITEDLKKIGLFPTVAFHFLNGSARMPLFSEGTILDLDESFSSNVDLLKFDGKLEIVETNVVSSHVRIPILHTSALKTNCMITNQPDWADLYVFMKPHGRLIVPESLLAYVVSLRNEQIFHEDACDKIYKELRRILNPEQLLVACVYTRRGGVDITPVRATSYELINNMMPGLAFTYYLHEAGPRQ